MKMRARVAGVAAMVVIMATVMILRTLAIDEPRAGDPRARGVATSGPSSSGGRTPAPTSPDLATLESRLDGLSRRLALVERQLAGLKLATPENGTVRASGGEGVEQQPPHARRDSPRPCREVPNLHPGDPMARVVATLGEPDFVREPTRPRGRGDLGATKKTLEYTKLGARVVLNGLGSLESVHLYGEGAPNVSEVPSSFDGDMSRFWFAPAKWSYQGVEVGMTYAAVIDKLGKPTRFSQTEGGFSLDYAARNLSVNLGSGPDFLVESFRINTIRP